MGTTTRRAYLEKTVTYKFALDVPNSTGITDSAFLAYAVGASGPINSSADIGKLLAGSASMNGSISNPAWTVSTSPASANIEEYSVFTPSFAYTLNQRVSPTANASLLFNVTTAGTTASTEPTWPTSVGGAVTSGGAVFTAIAKF